METRVFRIIISLCLVRSETALAGRVDFGRKRVGLKAGFGQRFCRKLSQSEHHARQPRWPTRARRGITGSFIKRPGTESWSNPSRVHWAGGGQILTSSQAEQAGSSALRGRTAESRDR